MVALLGDFANFLDPRRFVHGVVPHTIGDKVATIEELEEWMRGRSRSVRGSAGNHRKALELPEALRQFLRLGRPDWRGSGVAARLNARRQVPAIVHVSEPRKIDSQPETCGMPSGLGQDPGRPSGCRRERQLDGLKICGCEECRWVILRSLEARDPRWCSLTLPRSLDPRASIVAEVADDALQVPDAARLRPFGDGADIGGQARANR
jgi:hypothetical protein